MRLAFLKGYLKRSHEYVSYVNADQRAQSVGLKVVTTDVPEFKAYQSAVKFAFNGGSERFTIGGVVFSGPHPRIALVDDFPFEIEPEGTFLAICSRDRLGVVSAIASVLDHNNILISNFEFSHSSDKKRSMFLIRVGKKDVPEAVIDMLRRQEYITLVRRIQI